MLRFIRFQTKLTPPQYGWFFENRIGVIEGSIFSEYRRSEATIPVESVTLLPPITPGKIICIGRNYIAHAREENTEVPEVPIIFLKPPSAIIGPNDTIYLPPQSQQVEHEAELVVVIGKNGRWILPGEASQYILGYTIGNDITARDLQRRDGQWTRSKSFDTFCPIGPWITTDFDPADAMITCHVNDELRQMASTRDMVFRIPQLLAFVSSIMTLEPGDLLFTGTPAGVGPLVPGDIVEVSIEGIGILRNSVAIEPTH